MRAYVELYGVDPDRESVELAYEMADSEGSRIADGKARSLPVTGFGVPYVIELQTDSLSIGAFDLKALARQADDVVASMCGTFRVKSSNAVWFRDFDKMMDLLSYIGTKDQLEPLKEAPEEERRAAWEEFWAQIDPTPETSRNEVQDEFFERVAYANKHFGEMLGEGWQTDRGRIYITEGPPDSIESHPMDMSGNPWEAWYYNRRGIIFIFVDRSGFGEYVLVGTR